MMNSALSPAIVTHRNGSSSSPIDAKKEEGNEKAKSFLATPPSSPMPSRQGGGGGRRRGDALSISTDEASSSTTSSSSDRLLGRDLTMSPNNRRRQCRSLVVEDQVENDYVESTVQKLMLPAFRTHRTFETVEMKRKDKAHFDNYGNFTRHVPIYTTSEFGLNPGQSFNHRVHSAQSECKRSPSPTNHEDNKTIITTMRRPRSTSNPPVRLRTSQSTPTTTPLRNPSENEIEVDRKEMLENNQQDLTSSSLVEFQEAEGQESRPVTPTPPARKSILPKLNPPRPSSTQFGKPLGGLGRMKIHGKASKIFNHEDMIGEMNRRTVSLSESLNSMNALWSSTNRRFNNLSQTMRPTLSLSSSSDALPKILLDSASGSTQDRKIQSESINSPGRSLTKGNNKALPSPPSSPNRSKVAHVSGSQTGLLETSNQMLQAIPQDPVRTKKTKTRTSSTSSKLDDSSIDSNVSRDSLSDDVFEPNETDARVSHMSDTRVFELEHELNNDNNETTKPTKKKMPAAVSPFDLDLEDDSAFDSKRKKESHRSSTTTKPKAVFVLPEDGDKHLEEGFDEHLDLEDNIKKMFDIVSQHQRIFYTTQFQSCFADPTRIGKSAGTSSSPSRVSLSYEEFKKSDFAQFFESDISSEYVFKLMDLDGKGDVTQEDFLVLCSLRDRICKEKSFDLKKKCPETLIKSFQITHHEIKKYNRLYKIMCNEDGYIALEDLRILIMAALSKKDKDNAKVSELATIALTKIDVYHQGRITMVEFLRFIPFFISLHKAIVRLDCFQLS